MSRRAMTSFVTALLIAALGTVPVAAQDPSLGPPAATPLAEPPGMPAGSGTGVRLTTEKGDIVIGLFDRSSPVAAQNFLNLVESGYYVGTTFHRLVPGFVIQGGDPAGDGSGGPGYSIEDEPVVGTYHRGTVAMARTEAPDSGGSQFFVVLDDQAARSLDQARTYAIFGVVVEGMDVVDAIAAMPSSGEPDNRALEPVAITGAAVEQVVLPAEPSPGPAEYGDPELEAMFPDQLAGGPLQVESFTGDEIVAQVPDDPSIQQLQGVLATYGRTISDLSVAVSQLRTEDGDLAVNAIRVRGADAATLADALIGLLVGFEDPQVSSQTIGGKEVSVVTSGAAAEAGKRAYAYASGEVLWLVAAEEPLLTELFTALP